MPKEKKENLSILEDIYQESQVEQSDFQRKKKQERTTQIRKNIKDIFADDHRTERILAWGTLVFGVAALIFGYFHFQGNLARPFRDTTTLSQADQTSTAQPEVDEVLLELTKLDSDQDGLSDYQELYIYASSPFLEDSDSDGVSDFKEVENNTNPNCAFETNCSQFNTLGLPGEVGISVAIDINEQIANSISPAEVKQFLIDIGVEPARLEALNDQELLLVYQEILRENEGVVPEPNKVIIGQGTLEDLQPDELRQLLLENGVSQETLDTVTDEELTDLVEQATGN